MGTLLQTLNLPEDIAGLEREQLLALAEEVREKIVDSVSVTGGHLSSNLGTVELAVALHRVFHSPTDRLVWDVGHQAYPHKILTGRAHRFDTLRQTDGLSGFLSIFESEHDVFGAGHAGTACSAALGAALARDLLHENRRVVAIVGDGGLTAGMAFEALNHAGQLGRDFLVILNDNSWSISKNVGAMADYLNRIITGQFYNRAKADLESLIGSLPSVGGSMVKMMHAAEEHLKGMIVPGTWFEELGFRYFGPVDGHDLLKLVDTLESIKKLQGPIFLHCITKKGKGYSPAEEAPLKWHGATPFDKVVGKPHKKSPEIAYTDVFAETLVSEAREDDRVCAITAAMATGTGLVKFAEEFPERFFDAGIAEQHAVTVAAGMARGGLKPVVAIYSTFLQRAFDQIVHDVALQNLPVVFAVDRAGLVGADGATHQGVFDMTYLRMIPNMTVLCPSNEAELAGMLKTALAHGGPIAVRYPRVAITGEHEDWLETPPAPIGQAAILREGSGVALLAVGTMVGEALGAAERLMANGLMPWVIDMRSVKPLDRSLLRRLAELKTDIVTLEEHVLAGGFGAAVMEAWEEEGLPPTRMLRLGIQDAFVEHGAREVMLGRLGLDAAGIAESVRGFTHCPVALHPAGLARG
ncbi:MAG: 1-deoxy-D-xylulose-5-phosphate synthase [Candidatus Omnitrophica bacterium]|nr:1-deoxy-D-xylulose-5-phosphate synthase [bacterium]NUN94806.1 1-deoxy-D-xylulose-5-phosphate synthase [Candidatus Omnitrophota bacterium]